ncbi:MAG: hypothetical protein K6E14_10925 [Paludibacteraceae bacterium]|jgi:hypothetical protein|nr:hypothetical protein [Paludibacteraceae bacterium]
MENKINGYEYVDLGLPSGTLWASYDIGAQEVGGFGDLFMWGETVPKDSKTEWSDDDHKHISNENYVKYCERDKKLVLDPEDDAATSLWGNEWKIPSYTDWRELMKYCELKLKGESIVFVGPNGNELHFSRYLLEEYDGCEFSCSWWASELDSSDDEYDAIYFYIDKDEDCDPIYDTYSCHRACLLPIRPVSKIRADLNFELPEDDETEDDEPSDYEENVQSEQSYHESETVFDSSIVAPKGKTESDYQDNHIRKKTYIKDGYEKEKTSTLSYILFAIAILMLMFAIFNL